jgi:hypothetical protein
MRKPTEEGMSEALWTLAAASGSIGFFGLCVWSIVVRELPASVAAFMFGALVMATNGLVMLWFQRRKNPPSISDRLIVGPVPSSSALELATRNIITQGKNELAGLPTQSAETMAMMDIYLELEGLTNSKGSVGRKELEAAWFSKRRAFEELRAKFLEERSC